MRMPEVVSSFHMPHPPKPAPFIVPEQADFEWALKQIDSEIDVSEEDLVEICKLATQHAQPRTEGPSS